MVKENLWLYDDHADSAPRMYAYAIDYSGYYTMPAAYTGNVAAGGFSFPRPIVIGKYTRPQPPGGPDYDGGPLSLPPSHTWSSEHVEVRPDTLIGAGGVDGVGLTRSQLSTFKVVRTAAHFECYGYCDCFNAWDNVTISFGPCHWTLAWCHPNSPAHNPDPGEAREMPAFFAYMRNAYAAAYQTHFEIFGLTPEHAWPIALGGAGTYNDRITIQTESGSHVLCGASGARDYRRAENKYCKNWHAFYRFQMACRTSADMRRAMWDFARFRVRDILAMTFNIAGAPRRVGDYVTSEKGVAMLLRWHIYLPADMRNQLRNTILPGVINMPANQARENQVLRELRDRGSPSDHMIAIYGWANVPQTGLRGYYQLNLANPTLSNTFQSFQFEAP